jgi:hypothetical protein
VTALAAGRHSTARTRFDAERRALARSAQITAVLAALAAATLGVLLIVLSVWPTQVFDAADWLIAQKASR